MDTSELVGQSLFHGSAWTLCLCLETNRRWGETCVPLDVPVYYSLFPPSSFERLSFIWRLSSAENTALVEDGTSGSCTFYRRIHSSTFLSLHSLWSFLEGAKTWAILKKTLQQACSKCSLMPSSVLQTCRVPFRCSAEDFILFCPLLAHKNPFARLNLLRSLSGLNHVLLQQTSLPNHLESSPDLSSVGRDAEMIPKDQSSSSIRMTKKMWEKE